MTPEEKKARRAEENRRHREANKEKIAEHKRRYRESNKHKLREYQLQWREANREKLNELKRRKCRQKTFTKENGSSFAAWTASLNNPPKTYEAIANLTPDEGQTLAELIHELSDYAMEVCEQIANPPIEAEPEALTPEPTADLF